MHTIMLLAQAGHAKSGKWLLLKGRAAEEDVSGSVGVTIRSVSTGGAMKGPGSTEIHVEFPTGTTCLAGPVLITDDDVCAIFPRFVSEKELEAIV